jgi:DNA-binding FadR family transcriptional regulator
MTRLHESLTSDLLEDILDGKYAIGEWLPSEVRLSEERHATRTTVRGAIATLERRGVLYVRHGRGQRVEPEEAWDLLDADVLAAIVGARRLDLVGEIVECQALLEPSAAAHAAERATDAGIAELAAALEAVARASDGRRPRSGRALEDPVVKAEIEFHRALAQMIGNRPLQRMLAPIGTAVALARHELAAANDEALVRALRRTLKAIEARDPAAARKSVEARVTAARRWLKRAS